MDDFLARSVDEIKSKLKDDPKDPAYKQLQSRGDVLTDEHSRLAGEHNRLTRPANNSSAADQKIIQDVAKKLATFGTKAQKKQWFTSIPKHQQKVYCAHLKKKHTQAGKGRAKKTSAASSGGSPPQKSEEAVDRVAQGGDDGGGGVDNSVGHGVTRPKREPAKTAGGQKKEEQAIFNEDMAVDHATVKQKMATSHKTLRAQLAEQSARAQQRVRHIQEITQELLQLENPSRRDINEIRGRIEHTERDLVWSEKDLKAKEEAFRAAKVHCEKMRREKRLLIDHMRLILYESDKIKEDKIKELMGKLAYLQGNGAHTV